MANASFRRVILVVMDSVGVGALPDAEEYGDAGSNTLEHAAQKWGKTSLPNLQKLGLGKLVHLNSPITSPDLAGSFGKMAELSKGKDTTTGHWEMMGLITHKPLPTYPNGFPQSLIREFETKIGRKVIGNKPASGTEIIKELGEEHCRTGRPIVYTSGDSVFQIAAHEEVIPLEELYGMCKAARLILKGEHAVGRVIARPFVGKPGSFQRTHHRHDFSLEPFSETLLNTIQKAGLPTVSVGKIWDIFAGVGLTSHLDAGPNRDVMLKTLEAVNDHEFTQGLLFANLVDFDMLYNHRQDPAGFMQAMEEFDAFLPEILNAMRADDLLLITADHGNDPTDQSTDHTREYVPILCYGKRLRGGKNLGVRKSFADCGQTIAEVLGVSPLNVGESFASDLA
ncbi:MAG: phosphopentomutase [Elusimicrobia bacterium]|nr:phosphopentomutase [Elusimicrobiota bacterium]